jgi:hypothetical protein
MHEFDRHIGRGLGRVSVFSMKALITAEAQTGNAMPGDQGLVFRGPLAAGRWSKGG